MMFKAGELQLSILGNCMTGLNVFGDCTFTHKSTSSVRAEHAAQRANA